MHDLSGRLKGFLNQQASIRLAQLGHSEADDPGREARGVVVAAGARPGPREADASALGPGGRLDRSRGGPSS